MTIRKALSWIQGGRTAKVIVESDYHFVVQAINGDAYINSSLDLIIEDCKSILEILKDVRVVFTDRSVNHTTNNLAQAGGSLSGCQIQKDNSLDCISASLVVDAIE